MENNFLMMMATVPLHYGLALFTRLHFLENCSDVSSIQMDAILFKSNAAEGVGIYMTAATA